ncbi:Cnl2/NKP2 family protein-domain-containing protein [Fusarium flagelliforme]|uniref:Cnl2/NKP2 family protein-domain-containing protein n=1 Tax=Fusarium flagelliforme TaxID=2675880 RepID=UPI001E8D6377|nr:Cnl2/NKP2 family protein-domain-containing protein [Fusarium flagelliforme]KAH7192085.1 Cnl2/NKP2 family protein-domain-containing protein [Fusarium flagelliforme]
MAPTEAELLANYLIQPSTLTAITTLEQFKALFPRPLQSSPQVRSLFRDLQAQRADVLDQVAENIADEAKRGLAMRREVVRAKREAEREDIDAEIEIERALFGDASGAASAKHTLHSVIPELEGAAGALEAEIEKLQEEEAALLESVQQTVGALSDLRYGKFSNGQISDEVIGGLKNVEAACENKS